MPLRTKINATVFQNNDREIQAAIARKIRGLEKDCFKIYSHEIVKVVEGIDDRWIVYFDIVYDPPAVARASPEGCPK